MWSAEMIMMIKLLSWRQRLNINAPIAMRIKAAAWPLKAYKQYPHGVMTGRSPRVKL